MKVVFYILFLASLSFLSSQPVNREFELDNGNKILLGKVKDSIFLKKPHRDWFEDQYKNATINNYELSRLQIKPDSIKVFMGSWCGDSRRQLPVFLKAVRFLEIDDRVELICVDNREGFYKKSPGHEERGLNIHRVPTFIFYLNGSEKGRIVERPVVNMELDLLSIMDSDQYANYYAPIDELHNEISPSADIRELQEKYRSRIRNAHELNTYARVLFDSYDIAKAGLVYMLNTMLFPESELTNFRLGEYFEKVGNISSAKDYYQRALFLDESNTRSKERLQNLHFD